MRLSYFLEKIFPVPAEADREMTRLVLDSRQLKPNDLFVAMPGSRLDGRQYLQDAISRGVGAILMEAERQVSPVKVNGFSASLSWQQGVPVIAIDQLRHH